jgi:hypothetical protein
VDENRFWSMIEAAWGTVGGKTKPRRRLAQGRLSEDGAYSLQETLEEEVIPALQDQLAGLSADELLAFDRILERKLYDIGRADMPAGFSATPGHPDSGPRAVRTAAGQHSAPNGVSASATVMSASGSALTRTGAAASRARRRAAAERALSAVR